MTFQARDAGDPGLAGRYDLALIIEAVHDMANPVPVLRAARGLLAPGGALLIADEKVAESFNVPGDEVERIMYGYSVLFCLPNSLAEAGAIGTGTVLRPDRMRELAAEAGFSARHDRPDRARHVPLLPPRPVTPAAAGLICRGPRIRAANPR